MKKKILFFAMAFVACMSFVPNVYAKGNLAKIGDVKYATLQEAIDAALDGDTVLLVADTNENITIANDKNITLDLSEFTFTGVNNHAIVNNGKLTITGSDDGGMFASVCTTILNATDGETDLGKLTINGGSFFAEANMPFIT